MRECCRHEPLAKMMLNSEEFYRFFQYVEVSTFDIASDAFSTFKVTLPPSPSLTSLRGVWRLTRTW